MGIGILTMHWLEELDRRYNLFDGSSVAELGPSDLAFFPSNPHPYPADWWGRDYFGHLGCKEYKSFDLYDPRSTKCDLNDPPEVAQQFDVVTNFGTSEHVVNQFAVMRFMHDLTREGGWMLHQLPLAGGRDHGYFNYHPRFFVELARANNYELIHFSYIPHYSLQHFYFREPIEVSLLDKVQILDKGKLRTDEAAIKKATLRFFLKPATLRLNISLVVKILRNPKRRWGPFFDVYRFGDTAHIGFRKRSSTRFSLPYMPHYPE